MLEIDIKKVIALSTLRQLGVIMTIIGFGKPLLAYLHLLSHAYFKAILFMCAGIVIHNMKDHLRKLRAERDSQEDNEEKKRKHLETGSQEDRQSSLMARKSLSPSGTR